MSLRLFRNLSLLVLALGLGMSSGCITLKKDHDALAKQVKELEARVEASDEELDVLLARAEEQLSTLEGQLQKAERLLRSNQASVGVRVENLEYDLAEVRGLADDAQNELSALAANIGEMRGNLDERVNKLEHKLNEATDIPEGKTELKAAGEKALSAKNYKLARNLFRTYLARYPGDAAAAEVRFKIGLTLFSERDYRSALGEYYWIVQNEPKSSVINDALYYSGLAFAKLGSCEKATAYFQAIVREGSTAPERYKKQAAKQIKILETDAGKICTDRQTPNPDESAAPQPKPAPKAGS